MKDNSQNDKPTTRKPEQKTEPAENTKDVSTKKPRVMMAAAEGRGGPNDPKDK